MKKSTKTLLYSGVAIVAILIGLTIFVTVKDKRHFESIKETAEVIPDSDFTSEGIDSLAFNFPDYGHTRITVTPGDCDSINFSSADIAKHIKLSRQNGVLSVFTDKDFGGYLLTEITVTLKNIPASISTNGVNLLLLTDITADSIALNLTQNVDFQKCHFKSSDLKLSLAYNPNCIISGKDSYLGNTRLTTIEPVYVTDGVTFDTLTLKGNPGRAPSKVSSREDILRNGPLILFKGALPTIKIEKGEYPFGVYIDGPYEIKNDSPAADDRD